MCERVGEDSRYEIGHVDIRVGIMNSLECVCLLLHLNVCVCHCMSTWVGRLSLLGFAHPVVGPLFQVQVRCKRLTRKWDRMRDESWRRLCFVLFLSCSIFEQNMYTFLLYKRTVKWTVD